MTGARFNDVAAVFADYRGVFDVFLILVSAVTVKNWDVTCAGFFLVSDVFVDDRDFIGTFVNNWGVTAGASEVGSVIANTSGSVSGDSITSASVSGDSITSS